MTHFPVIIEQDIFRGLMTSSNYAFFHRHIAFDEFVEDFGYGPFRDCPGQGNDFELIPMAKLETSHPIEGYFGNEFPSTCNHCGVMTAMKSQDVEMFCEIFAFFGKTTTCGKIFKILFRKDSSPHRSM